MSWLDDGFVKRKADDGVIINVLLAKSIFVPIDFFFVAKQDFRTFRACRKLTRTHENILQKVIKNTADEMLIDSS